MTLSIRTLAKSDFDQWRDLWTDYLKFYETTVPDDTYAITFARLLDVNRSNQNAFVAEQDRELIGFNIGTDINTYKPKTAEIGRN